MKRVEFSKKTMLERFQYANGHCEACGCKLLTGRINYDHDNPETFSHDNSFNNCRAMCRGCHDLKTFGKDIPAVAKSNRIRAKHLGIRRHSSRPMPGSRASGI